MGIINVTFADVTVELMEGFLQTILLFISTLVISIPLGILICYLRKSKIKAISSFMSIIIWVVRGTPLMLQIFIFVYAPGLLFNIPVKERFFVVALAFGINYACYFAEIFRGGINAIDKGQIEAAKTLGMTKIEIFFKVSLLQIIKNILPSMSNEIITLVKDTALARTVAICELLKSSEDLVNKYVIIYPLFYAGLFYLLFNGILSYLFRFTEKKLSYFGG